MIWKILGIIAIACMLVCSWHHSFVHACEGGPQVSGKIVVGDSIEDVMDQLKRSQV